MLCKIVVLDRKSLPLSHRNSLPISSEYTDCGGPPGYEHLLQVIRDPKDPEYRDLTEWLGNEFDPERFDATAYRWLPIMLTYS